MKKYYKLICFFLLVTPILGFSQKDNISPKLSFGWLVPTRAILNNVHHTDTAATYYGSTIFPDSTVRYESSGVLSYIWLNSAGEVFDPYSKIYDPLLINPLIQPGVGYFLDSLFLSGWYKKINGGNPDTLVAEVTYSLPKTAPSFAGTFFTNPPDTFWVSPPKVFGDTARFGFKCRMTDPNKVVVKYILSSSDSSTTLEKKIKFPVNIQIPADNIVGVSFTFVPGNPYNAGDIVYSSNASFTQVLNSFRVAEYVTNNYTINQRYFSDLNKRFNSSHLIKKEIRYHQYTGTNAWQNDRMFSTLDWGFDIGFMISIPQNINTLTENKFSIYPNPSSNLIHIKGLDNQASNLDIYNFTGQLIYSETINENEHTLDISQFASGMYLLKISNKNFTQSEKLVIE